VVDAAKAFLTEAAACEEKIYDSVGLGKDYRYSGPKLVGSALAVEDAVIHTAFSAPPNPSRPARWPG